MVVRCKARTKDHLPLKTAFSGPRGWSLVTGFNVHVVEVLKQDLPIDVHHSAIIVLDKPCLLQVVNQQHVHVHDCTQLCSVVFLVFIISVRCLDSTKTKCKNQEGRTKRER